MSQVRSEPLRDMLIYFVSFIAFIFSIMVVTSASPITSVVYLIGTFILTAIYLSSQGMYYIALTYIVVYVGAVITLFLFVVMIMNLGSAVVSQSAPFTQTLPLTVVTVLMYTVLIISSNSDLMINQSALFPNLFQYLVHPESILSTYNVQSTAVRSFTSDSASHVVNHWNQIQSIGFELYTHQAMYLVLVSIVLIVSIIGPIVICGSSSNRQT